MVTKEDILKQEEELQFVKFDNETAIDIGLGILKLARKRQLPVTINITRCRQQLFHAALPGTSADNDRWINCRVPGEIFIEHKI